MDKNAVKAYLVQLIGNKLKLFNISPGELKDDFDLVKSGLLDSMSFIDVIAAIEEKFSLEIDFERVAESDEFTTFGGIVKLVLNAKNDN